MLTEPSRGPRLKVDPGGKSDWMFRPRHDAVGTPDQLFVPNRQQRIRAYGTARRNNTRRNADNEDGGCYGD